jgi:hypothetical protein
MKTPMQENDLIWQAIDRGGGQTCNIEGVIRELKKAGFEIVPSKPTNEMRDEFCYVCQKLRGFASHICVPTE